MIVDYSTKFIKLLTFKLMRPIFNFLLDFAALHCYEHFDCGAEPAVRRVAVAQEAWTGKHLENNYTGNQGSHQAGLPDGVGGRAGEVGGAGNFPTRCGTR